jgi:probable rRNA maturation factor
MIEIENRQNSIDITEEINNTISDAIEEALLYEKFQDPFDISVIITDNPGIKAINLEFRNIDRETDVLSFPLLNYEDGPYEYDKFEASDEDINPENGAVLLGDIVISIEKAYSQAAEYGHSFSREIAFLVVHSVLHLLGYDHEIEEDKVIMRNKEENILNTMMLFR